jgi:hypothetical protein
LLGSGVGSGVGGSGVGSSGVVVIVAGIVVNGSIVRLIINKAMFWWVIGGR